jgi:hypothetical protein
LWNNSNKPFAQNLLLALDSDTSQIHHTFGAAP